MKKLSVFVSSSLVMAFLSAFFFPQKALSAQQQDFSYDDNTRTISLYQLQDTFPGPRDMADRGQAQRARIAKIENAKEQINRFPENVLVQSIAFESALFEPGDYLESLLRSCLRFPHLNSISFNTVVFKAKAVNALSATLGNFGGQINFVNCSATDDNPQHNTTVAVLHNILPNCNVYP